MAGYARHRRAGEPACDECLAGAREDLTTRRRADPERHRTLQRERMLKWRSGITLAEYEALLEAQGGVCAVCGSDDPERPQGPGRFAVDHDHACCPGKRSCGKCVRGLLCHPCNLLLGNARESTATLLAAIEYLDGGD